MSLTLSGDWKNRISAMKQCHIDQSKVEILLTDDQEWELQNGGLDVLKGQVSVDLARCMSIRPHWLSRPAALVVDATKSR